MKKLIVAFFTLLTGFIANAQDTSLIQPPLLPPYSEQEISREKIQTHDLPEAVKESLKAPDYAGWTVDSAYKACMTDPKRPESEGIVIYIIELRRQKETATIKFDRDGKRLDDNDHK